MADALLTADERAQISQVIDDQSFHSNFNHSQRAAERVAVLEARVGVVRLEENGIEQIIVRGPALACGAAGFNCSIWIFVRQPGKLKLVLTTGGNSLIAKRSSRLGFHDLASRWHMGADDAGIAVYRWDGNQYQQSDCYDWKIDNNNPAPRTALSPR